MALYERMSVKNRGSSAIARHVALKSRLIAKLFFGIVVAFWITFESADAQITHGPQGPEEGAIRRQLWLIPTHDRASMMRTTLFRPPGAGPFPLVVINHGSTQNELQRAAYRLPEYTALAQWFVARGYAVAVPQRPGHGESGGLYYEDQGGCEKADYRKAGYGAAASIAAVIDYLTRQPFVRKTGAIVTGQSAGAWGGIALAARNVREVKAVIAFAPGRGGRIDGEAGKNCAPERLIAAAREFGEKARTPTLWIYAENDSYFPPALSRKVAEAFRLAGGKAEVHILPPFGADGHELIRAPEAVPVWAPVVERFLAGIR
jgi:dienelactone hydrolase